MPRQPPRVPDEGPHREPKAHAHMILFDTVTKKYPRTTRPAVDGVSLEVERGEFVFIVGQSGSGKSTLLRLALKEENATSGSVFVAGP